MSKALALAFVLVFLTVSIIVMPLPVKAENKTITVPDDYRNISGAIGNATQGDTIYVKQGTYNEQVLTVDKPLQIRGENANNTKIILHPSLIFGGYNSVMPSQYYYYHESIMISANNVELSNFTISYQETSEPPPDLSLHGLSTYVVGGGGGLTIRGNATKVTGNIFNNVPVTIEGTNSQISANFFKMGVECRGSNNQIFHNNFIYQFFKGINDVPYVYDDSNSGNFWDDGYPSGGNYWIDYQTRYADSKMIDGSGIGDTPYLIGSNNSDRYPLMSPFDYKSYLTRITPPKISIISPINHTIIKSNVSLDFTTDKAVNWTSYSLDGQQNKTLSGNITIANLPKGLHNIAIYANDSYGNVGTKAVIFTIQNPQTEIWNTIIIVVIAVPVTIVCFIVGMLLYRRHRKTSS